MPKLFSIQTLRALAAMGVVLFHSGIELSYWGHTSMDWNWSGAAGVDVFFVISGFIMVSVSWDHFGKPGAWRTFLLRRLVRIVPLYWLVTTVYVFGTTHPLSRVLGSYFFVWSGEDPILRVGWTLDYEMFFYALFTIGMLLPRAAALPLVAATLIAFTLFKVAFYGNLMVLEFVFGMGLAVAYMRGVRLNTVVRLVLIVGGFAVIVWTRYANHDLLLWGVPAALIVAGATLGEEINPLSGASAKVVAALVALGNASYALYLIHLPIVRGIATGMRKMGVPLAEMQTLYFVIAAAASIGAALLVHRFIEQPVLVKLNARMSRRRAAPAEGAAELSVSRTPS